MSTAEPFPAAAIPSHVPPHLVRDTDLWAEIAAAGVDAYAHAGALHQSTPPIFYVPRLGYLPGAWVPRRTEDLRRIVQDTDTFSSKGYTPFPKLLGEDWQVIPVEIDPPQHTKYRALLNPLFSPARIDQLEQSVRAHAGELIDRLVARGECDFNADFANLYPTLIFLRLMGWPVDDAPQFVQWTQTIIKSQDMAQVVGAVKEVRDFLRQRIAERRLTPGDDFTGYLIKSQIDGRPLTDDEVFGMAFLVFIGGLDTVASSLGLHFMHLARHPEQQAELRAHPERIPQAVEELLRAYSIVNSRRTVTREVTIGEVTMQPGDFVLICTNLGNLDPEKFDDPQRVDFNRADAHVPHMAFNFGPHRCVGSHLARRELRIALELWLKKVPPFRMTEHPIQIRASGVFGVDGLHLAWDQPTGAQA
jgi:cytochrome P450